MPIQWCSNYQFNAPVDADGVSVTPSGTAFNNSAWVTVFTADADCVLTSLSFQPGTTATFEVDVGVDTGGGESVIATHTGQVANSTTIGGTAFLPFRIPIDAIPNGAAVKVRMRKSGTNTTAWIWQLTYYKKPIVGTILTTANPQLITTVNGAPTLDSINSAWANGDWTAIFTASADSVITGFVDHFIFNGADYILEFGISSTPIWSIKGRQGLGDFSIYKMIKHPLQIASGASLDARWRKAGTSLSEMPLVLTYYELPL